jgi:hypothetical protein
VPEIKFIDTDLSQWIAPRVTPPRSAGHHVSDVLVRMLKIASRKFDHYGKTEADGGIPLETRETMWRIGFLWEDVMTDVLNRQLTAPEDGRVLPAVELELDGLYGTPDRIIYRPEAPRWRLEETKVTWMSTRDIAGDPKLVLRVPKFAYWTLQIKTYAAMMSHPDVANRVAGGNMFATPTAPTCILRALFVNNDYRQFLPVPVCWSISWSLDELAAHWSMMRSFLETEAQNEANRVADGRSTNPETGDNHE